MQMQTGMGGGVEEQMQTGMGGVEEELPLVLYGERVGADSVAESNRVQEARAETPGADSAWTEQTLKRHADELFGLAFFSEDDVDDDETTHPRASESMPSAYVAREAGHDEGTSADTRRFAE